VAGADETEEIAVAELTNLESKLGEVTGLAMAAQVATEKITRLAEEEDGLSELVRKLERMHEEAAETERRCQQIIDTLEGKKTAIREEAAATKRKGGDMLSTYIDAESDALDGFEFLTMAEAGEVGHWKILRTMTEHAGDSEVTALCEWAIPIQERHFADVTRASLELAAAEDPAAVG
jgi:hypothetical protein